MKSSKEYISMAERLDRIEGLAYDLVLKELKIKEKNIIKLQLACKKQCDWEQAADLQDELEDVWGQIDKWRMAIRSAHEKRKFQKKLQRKHGDSKVVIVHEYNLYVDPPRINFEIIPKHVEEQTSLAPHGDIQESNNEEVVETPCVEINDDLEAVVETPCVESDDDFDDMGETPSVESVKDLEEVVEVSFVEMIVDLKGDDEIPCGEIVDAFEEMVETSCVGSVGDLEEVVETTCMENVDPTIECFEVVDSHTRIEVGLQGEQTRKHEFVKVDFVLKKSPLVDYVHVERFVEFNPTKIRGRMFSKKGRMQQVECGIGNTSKLIFLVSLFNVWVWFIMQLRTKAFILTCVSTRNSPAAGPAIEDSSSSIHSYLCSYVVGSFIP